jgi:hypothetical protein
LKTNFKKEWKAWMNMKNILEIGWVWWHMPAIPTFWEAEIERIMD